MNVWRILAKPPGAARWGGLDVGAGRIEPLRMHQTIWPAREAAETIAAQLRTANPGIAFKVSQ